MHKTLKWKVENIKENGKKPERVIIKASPNDVKILVKNK